MRFNGCDTVLNDSMADASTSLYHEASFLKHVGTITLNTTRFLRQIMSLPDQRVTFEYQLSSLLKKTGAVIPMFK